MYSLKTNTMYLGTIYVNVIIIISSILFEQCLNIVSTLDNTRTLYSSFVRGSFVTLSNFYIYFNKRHIIFILMIEAKCQFMVN